jgi:hypothetical protein
MKASNLRQILPRLTDRQTATISADHQPAYVCMPSSQSQTGARQWRADCSCGHKSYAGRNIDSVLKAHADHRTAIFTGARQRLAQLDARA